MSVQMLVSVGMAGNRSSVFDQATALYARARSQGQQSGLRSILKGRSRCLHILDGVDTGGEVRTRRCEGIQTVPITQIQGSESRSSDFDRDFHPLQDRTRERWLSVAVARQRGKSLPPVELIRVGEIYFVRDGHHRISVARALGQQEIEARVLVWQVAGPLPWEAPVTGQGIGWGQLFQKMQDGAARLQERALPGLASLSKTFEMGLKTALASLTAVIGG